MSDKGVSNNYYNIPSKLSNDEVLIYYQLCEDTNFTKELFDNKKRFECFGSKRTLSKNTGIGDKKVLIILRELEKKGYIRLVSRGKPPKTPSKYKMIYAEKIKNREPFESIENTEFERYEEPLKEKEPLNVPINEPLNEPMESIENKGVDVSCEPLKEPLEEPLMSPLSKDISNNIYSAKKDEDSEIYVKKIDDIWDRLNNKYDYELIQREKKKLIDKDLKGLELLIELERQLEKHNKKTDKNNLDKEVEEIWKLYPLKKGKANAIKKIPSLLKKYGKEQLKRCIERYVKDVEYQRANKFRDLNYKNGSTFFNGGYVDYLDCNYEEIKAKDIQQSEVVQVEEDNFEY